MSKYRWEQHYGIDRFDLSGPRGFPSGGIGWITRNPDDPNTVGKVFITRGFMGYMTSMKNEDPPGAGFHWRVWWDERDEDKKLIIRTDEIRHRTRAEAMRALEVQHGIDSSEVKEIKWEGNLSTYE
jgi:hypothetical protein